MKFSIIFAIVGVLFFFLNAFMHEQAHVQINNAYGINSKVEYLKDFPDITTYGDKPCPVEECVLAHNLNEVEGYNSTGTYLMIFAGLFFMIILMEAKFDERYNS